MTKAEWAEMGALLMILMVIILALVF